MKTNPLPGHNGPTINVIEESEHFAIVKKVNKMKKEVTRQWVLDRCRGWKNDTPTSFIRF